jgi:hypothetical protein
MHGVATPVPTAHCPCLRLPTAAARQAQGRHRRPCTEASIAMNKHSPSLAGLRRGLKPAECPCLCEHRHIRRGFGPRGAAAFHTMVYICYRKLPTSSLGIRSCVQRSVPRACFARREQQHKTGPLRIHAPGKAPANGPHSGRMCIIWPGTARPLRSQTASLLNVDCVATPCLGKGGNSLFLPCSTLTPRHA